jgi:hypothetical protein
MLTKRKPTVDDAYDMKQRSNAPESEAVTLDDHAIFEAARQAVTLLKKTFETWVVIGKAVVRARNIANQRGGAKTFMRVIQQQGLGPIVNKSTASTLERIMEKLPEVTKWHEGLTSRQQIDWAAPTTILKRCPVFAKAPTPDNNEEPKFKPVDLERAIDSVLHHLSEIDDADHKRTVVERIAGPSREDGDTFNPKTSSVKEIARALIDQLEPFNGKAERVAKEMLVLIKARKTVDA